MSLGESSFKDPFDDINENIWKIDIKYKKILSILKNDTDNLISTATLYWNLNKDYDDILFVLVKIKEGDMKTIFEEILAKDKCNDLTITKKDALYKATQRRIHKLRKIELIIESSSRHLNNLNKDIPLFSLTLNGLVYSIIHSEKYPFNSGKRNMLVDLFKNYSNNIIFQRFLYPYFEKTTLVSNILPFSDVLYYLEEVCKVVVINRRAHNIFDNSLIEGSLPRLLFIWPPPKTGNMGGYGRYFSKKSELRKLLFRELDWIWINEADIQPSFDDNIITIKNEHLSPDAIIKIDKKEKNVTLIHGNKKYRFFNMNVTKDQSVIVSGKSESNGKQYLDQILYHSSRSKLIELIYLLIAKYSPLDSSLSKLLKADKKFKSIVKELVNIINLED